MLLNLQNYKSHFKAIKESGIPVQLRIPLEPICPICLNKFSEDIEERKITKEDAPPKSLGGHKVVFTCKKCNS